MKLKETLFGIFSLGLIAFGIWIVILFNVDPSKADSLSFITFIASLFLWLSSAFTLTEYIIRLRSLKGEMKYAPLHIASRHGIMIALTITLLLSLQYLNVLNFIDAILIIIIIFLSELYFKARPNAKSTQQ